VAKEMAKYNVTVNAIWPGADTRMTQSVPERARQIRQDQGITVSTRQVDRHPRHVAPVVVYLASDEAADITGQTIAISGNRLQIISNPEPIRTAYRDEGWTIESLIEYFDTTIGDGVNLYRL
jgi:hypothetical protein